MADHLHDDADTMRTDGLRAIVTAYGRELVEVAYLVLQHNADAQRAAAAALAEVSGSGSIDAGDRLHEALLASCVRHAVQLRTASQTVDPDLPGRTGHALRQLAPATRVAVALRVRHQLGLDAVGRITHVDPDELEAAIAAAGPGPLQAELRSTLDGQPVLVDVDMVRSAAAASPPPPTRRWPILLAGAVAATLLAVAIGATGQSSDAPTTPEPKADVVLTPPTVLVEAVSGRSAVAPFTLAACQLAPADASLSFAGWLSKGSLGIDTGADRDAPAYAIITSGRANGRVGCAFDPADGSYAPVGLAADWRPPVGDDGCPSSPATEFGGYQELGGPGAFVLPSVGPAAQVAGQADGQLLVRIAPSGQPVTRVTASLQAETDGRRVQAQVSAESVRSATTTSSWYLWLNGISVPTPGCWTLNVSVDGAVVGVASLPFSAPD